MCQRAIVFVAKDAFIAIIDIKLPTIVYCCEYIYTYTKIRRTIVYITSDIILIMTSTVIVCLYQPQANAYKLWYIFTVIIIWFS